MIESTASFKLQCPFSKGLREFKQVNMTGFYVIPFIALNEVWYTILTIEFRDKRQLHTLGFMEVKWIIIDIAD